MVISKSEGVTPTERLLADLAKRTFANLWAYPNPYKEDGKELCDLLVVFENRAFIFFDRESRRFDRADKDILVNWQRWRKEAVDKQINTARGATRYIRSGRPIFLNEKAVEPFPLDLSSIEHIHRFVVAHGAQEACIAFSDDNIAGSLAISYGDPMGPGLNWPFMLELGRTDPVHVLDTHNLEIVFSELDTAYDFSAFIAEKERAIERYIHLCYCGEEDLLGHYFTNFSEAENRYTIGVADKSVDGLAIAEGGWEGFVELKPYKLRKKANQVSYFWDEMINRTGQNAIDGNILGESEVWKAENPIHEMAREPRFHRRALSEKMISAIQNFPDDLGPAARTLSFMPSFFADKGYVFLQVRHDNPGDYEAENRSVRLAMLEIACGAAKNKFPHLSKIVGIAINASKFTDTNSEDFLLMDCSEWTKERQQHYQERNSELGFFQTGKLKQEIRTISDFPKPAHQIQKKKKIGRNEPCPCRSGKKYKKCCGKVA